MFYDISVILTEDNNLVYFCVVKIIEKFIHCSTDDTRTQKTSINQYAKIFIQSTYQHANIYVLEYIST